MKGRAFILVVILFFVCVVNNTYSQYYTAGQIQLINTNKTAFEGDMYLDTLNQKFYIGLTTGQLARIGDTLDELIDSVLFYNDTLTFYEGDSAFKVLIEPNKIDSITKKNVTANSDSLLIHQGANTFKVLLTDVDSANELIDSIRIDNDTLKVYESDVIHYAIIPRGNNAVPLWKTDSSDVVYDSLDIINYAGELYRNKSGANADSVPNVDTANWTQITGVSYTGWADYVDGSYTSASPFIVGNTKVTLPNAATTIRDGQKPIDVTTFYNSADSAITGRDGDGINIVIEFKARPNTNIVTRITTSIDIGGVVGEIYTRDFVLSKGNNVEHYYLSSFDAYTLNTWEANGGKVKIISTDSVDIYDIRYIITRTHKAR